jgi:hypothetical protein
MADLYRTGSVKPVYFKITLNGVGVSGLTLQAADIKLSLDDATAVNIGGEVTEATIGLGWYKWTPASSARTTGDIVVVNVKDDDAGGEFDENGFVLHFGGDQSVGFFTGV